MLPNQKTYIVCALTAIYAVVGFVAGIHDAATMSKLIADSLIGSTIRAGIAKVGAYNKPK